MSEPASASPRYTGSPLGDPRAEKIGEFTAMLSQQPANFQAAVASVRASLEFHQPGYVSMPYSIELSMADGTVIKSQIVNQLTALSPQSGKVRVVLAKWDGPRFTWCIIEIVSDNMTIGVHCNPSEVRNEWRKPSPTIVPPPTDGTNA